MWGDRATELYVCFEPDDQTNNPSYSLRAFESRDDDRFNFAIASPRFTHAKVVPSREDVVKAFHEISGWTDVEFGDLTWISNYRPNIRMVDCFGIGRVFVAGGTLPLILFHSIDGINRCSTLPLSKLFRFVGAPTLTNSIANRRPRNELECPRLIESCVEACSCP